MRYSLNIDRKNLALAQRYEINASYKDLVAVCSAIKYLKTDKALEVLDGVINIETPIRFLRYNKYMGSRHELGGQKGAFPSKAAGEVKEVVLNAIANSESKGMDSSSLYVVHASANKTHIERRRPSKGSLFWGRGMYGASSGTHSDVEYAKVEIGLANADEQALTEKMKQLIKLRNPVQKIKAKPKEKVAVAKGREKKQK